MKKIIIYTFLFIGIISFINATVEAKIVEPYSYASGGGSGSGSGGGASCGGFLTQDAVDIIREILGYFRVLGPILLIVLVAVDFGGAVLAQDSDAMKKATSKVVSRVIGVVLLYFVPTIVRFVLGLPGVQETIVISDDPLCNTMNSYPTEEIVK